MDKASTHIPKYQIIILMILVLLIGGLLIIRWLSYSDLVKHSLHCEGVQSRLLQDIAIPTIENYHYPTLQIAHIDKLGQVSTCHAGWEGYALFSKKIEDTTVYAYASLTKIFTSDAVLSLVREHQLSLDDKLVNVLPVLGHQPYTDNRVTQITIGQLLSHRAGFDRNISGDNMLTQHPWCPYDVGNLKNIKLDFTPNQKKVYSNTGYCLLSKVIEHKTNTNFMDSVDGQYYLTANNIQFIQRYQKSRAEIPSVNQRNQINNIEFASFDYYALASTGGLTGSAISLARQLKTIEVAKSPNITERPSDMKDCDVSVVDGCHGYMGYEYSVNPNLTFYWRSGSLPNTTALAIIDNKGGVWVLLTNYRQDNEWINQINLLIKTIYNNQLKAYK
ncbi:MULTISPECIES: serine hydrolase domain-containing protein [unclassified Moraxella]|uniref:serine hydrolase domain-containing protein n=1 Tax=unclassified Moraxella TaxID=2685852 RepID=UPI003AF5754E